MSEELLRGPTQLLTELLERSRGKRVSILSLSDIMDINKPIDSSDKEERGKVIASYVKTLVASDKIQELLRLLECERQLTILLDAVTSIDYGPGNASIPGVIYGKWNPKLKETKDQLRTVFDATKDMRWIPGLMLKELKTLGYDEQITLPEVVLDLPAPLG